MILFSGHGEISTNFSRKFPCEIISLRNKSIKKLEEILPLYEIIIHNAANINPTSLEEASNDNFVLTKTIIDTLCRVNAKSKFIYLSSMSILKNSEEYLPPLQMSQYAFSKYLGEVYTLMSPLYTKTIRFSTIFYENPTKDGLSKLIWDASRYGKITLYNGGLARRDFIPIEVLTNYLYNICTKNSAQQVYTLCSGVSTSFFEVSEIIKKKIPDLLIENQPLNSPAYVLDKFSTKNLKELGVIKYHIEEYINNYLNKISLLS